MTIDDRLRAGLAVLADEVRPAPDPLGRLLSRRTRRRAWWGAGSVSTVVAALIAGLVVVALPAAGPGAVPTWVAQLLDAPPRGSVAVQAGFASALTAAFDAQNKAGDTEPVLAGFRESDSRPVAQRGVRLLLAEDVGTARVALVALVGWADATHQVQFTTVLVWLVGPRGASPQTLVAAARAQGRPAGTGMATQDMQPFLVEDLAPPDVRLPGGTLVIGLAPPGCVVASAPLPAATAYRDEPTGSFIARAPAQRRGEWWRVTCGGVVRYEEPAPIIADPDNPDTIQLSAAAAQAGLVGARGTVDPERARSAMMSLRTVLGYALSAPPVTVWGGRAELPSPPGNVIVVAAPLVDGGWAAQAELHADGQAAAATVGLVGFTTQTDPRDPTALLAVRFVPPQVSSDGQQVGYEGPANGILAVAPTGAVTIRSVLNGQTIDQVPAVGGGAILPAPDEEGLMIEALDAGGTVLARAVPYTSGLRSSSRPAAGWPQ